MGILRDQLPNSILGLKGVTPPISNGAKNTSTLHYLSSITGNPPINLRPSQLDLDGKTPPKYLDNLPE